MVWAGVLPCRAIDRWLAHFKKQRGCPTVAEIKSVGGEFALSKTIMNSFNANINIFFTGHLFILKYSLFDIYFVQAQKTAGYRLYEESGGL